MGRLGSAGRALALVGVVALTGSPGCRSSPKPGEVGRGAGVWHVVAPGENLWRISQQKGTPVEVIRRVNGVTDVRALRVGQRLWIPKGSTTRGAPAVSAAAPVRAETLEQQWGGDCSDAAREHGLRFEWPVIGTTTSAYGARRGRNHDGIDIAARKGTPIHAAEAGKVVYVDDRFGAYGRIVVVKHVGSWATVYAHNDANLADEGDFVEKGDPIARVGRTGNASAPHLHFEIRRSNRPRDPQACLP